jgi:diadenosine tetraphosphate (Ap4A) HIT family hydrolase
MSSCPFCSIDSTQSIRKTDTATALFDTFPVSEGHTLVVPRRHVASIYGLPAVEQTALWEMVGDVRRDLIARFGVEAFNIGVNDGAAAGQTIPHAHIHVIPRRPGDVKDPRGGVRWVIAEKAAYWKS